MFGLLTRDGGEKGSRHSRCMRNPNFYISDKRPIEAWILWPPFYRWHFQVYFRELQNLHFYKTFPKFSSLGSKWQVIIGQGNGFVESHYLKQYWQKYTSLYGVKKQHWFKDLTSIYNWTTLPCTTAIGNQVKKITAILWALFLNICVIHVTTVLWTAITCVEMYPWSWIFSEIWAVISYFQKTYMHLYWENLAVKQFRLFFVIIHICIYI